MREPPGPRSRTLVTDVAASLACAAIFVSVTPKTFRRSLVEFPGQGKFHSYRISQKMNKSDYFQNLSKKAAKFR